METIGDRIRKAREARGMSQAQLQVACGWHSARVWKYENDKSGTPSTDVLTKIADALHVSIDYLVRGHEAPADADATADAASEPANGAPT